MQKKEHWEPDSYDELKRSLEEAEVVKKNMELALMRPDLKTALRNKYRETIPVYRAMIRELKFKMALHRRAKASLTIHEPKGPA